MQHHEPPSPPSDTARRIVPVRPNSPRLQAVIALGDANRRTTGLLPTAAWEDYAQRGHLIAVVGDQDPDVPLAYAAFRLPRHEVVLAHLVVAKDNQGKGLARLLVEHLSGHYQDRRGVAARCRRDWPAHAIWPRLGFVPRGERPGRGKDGKPLTRWWLDHGHPDLMTWTGPAPGLAPLVLDVNAFLDLHSSEGADPRTKEVLLGTLDGRVELLLSPEVHNEIDRRLSGSQRRRMHELAESYVQLAVKREVRDEFLQRLQERLPRRAARVQAASDVRHVADAAAAGVGIFVTRDEEAIRRIGPVATELFGTRLVTPQDLVAVLDEAENAPSYWPAALLGTGYAMTEVPGGDDDPVAVFLNHGAGEKRHTLARVLRDLAALRPGSHRFVYSNPQGQPVGIVGAAPQGDSLLVPLLRLLPGPLIGSLAVQVVAGLRDLAKEAGLSRIDITEPLLGEELFSAAEQDGYRSDGGRLVAYTLNRSLSLADLSALLSNLAADGAPGLESLLDSVTRAVAGEGAARLQLAAVLEHQLRPLRLVDAGLPTWLVPIKPAWSSQLFNVPTQLFGQPDRLGISREHVYYRAAVDAGERVPGRVLWYVSRPESKIVACSALVGVDQGAPDELWRRYRRLGVYERSDVLATAGARRKVRCLRVHDTQVLARPVPHERLRELADTSRQTLRLVSATEISNALYEAVMREGDGDQ